MYALLKAQTRQNKIPAMLPDGVKTANKTGELDNVEMMPELSTMPQTISLSYLCHRISPVPGTPRIRLHH